MSVETCKKYVFDMPVGDDDGPERTRRRDAVLTRMQGAAVAGEDTPTAQGVSITGTEGDVAGIDTPYMAVLGEPLDAMVQNLGQTDNSYVSAGSTNKVVSQAFTTSSNDFGYRLQGIGVNIEGSGSNYPDNPTSVSVCVHEDVIGKPGDKLFDLVSPGEYAAGHSFFEAPPGTHLAPETSYVMVWRYVRGTTHRLQKTSSNGEDSGAATNASIANAFYLGANLASLSEDTGGNSVEIAVYTEVNTEVALRDRRHGAGGPLRALPGRRLYRQVLRPSGRTLPYVRRRLRGGARLTVNDHDGGSAYGHQPE